MNAGVAPCENTPCGDGNEHGLSVDPKGVAICGCTGRAPMGGRTPKGVARGGDVADAIDGDASDGDRRTGAGGGGPTLLAEPPVRSTVGT